MLLVEMGLLLTHERVIMLFVSVYRKPKLVEKHGGMHVVEMQLIVAFEVTIVVMTAFILTTVFSLERALAQLAEAARSGTQGIQN